MVHIFQLNRRGDDDDVLDGGNHINRIRGRWELLPRIHHALAKGKRSTARPRVSFRGEKQGEKRI